MWALLFNVVSSLTPNSWSTSLPLISARGSANTLASSVRTSLASVCTGTLEKTLCTMLGVQFKQWHHSKNHKMPKDIWKGACVVELVEEGHAPCSAPADNVHVEARGPHECHCWPHFLLLLLLLQGLSVAYHLLGYHWWASESHGSVCLSLPRAGILSACHHTWILFVASGNGTQVLMFCTSPTEPSPQGLVSDFVSVILCMFTNNKQYAMSTGCYLGHMTICKQGICQSEGLTISPKDRARTARWEICATVFMGL